MSHKRQRVGGLSAEDERKDAPNRVVSSLAVRPTDGVQIVAMQYSDVNRSGMDLSSKHHVHIKGPHSVQAEPLAWNEVVVRGQLWGQLSVAHTTDNPDDAGAVFDTPEALLFTSDGVPCVPTMRLCLDSSYWELPLGVSKAPSLRQELVDWWTAHLMLDKPRYGPPGYVPHFERSGPDEDAYPYVFNGFTALSPSNWKAAAGTYPDYSPPLGTHGEGDVVFELDVVTWAVCKSWFASATQHNTGTTVTTALLPSMNKCCGGEDCTYPIDDADTRADKGFVAETDGVVAREFAIRVALPTLPLHIIHKVGLCGCSK